MSVSDLPSVRPGFGARFSAAYAALAAWGEAYFDRLSRGDVVRRLQAKSDAELAAMGLTRETIVAHVFRDRMGL